MANLIGARIERKEDKKFLTGKGNYTADINLARQTYACFVRSPHARAKITKVDIPQDTQTLVVLFHGAKDHLNPELEALANEFRIYLDTNQNAEVINYNWSYGSDNRLRASTNAIKIGESLGSEIAKYKRLRHIRLIGHSVGAFIPDALCKAYKEFLFQFEIPGSFPIALLLLLSFYP